MSKTFILTFLFTPTEIPWKNLSVHLPGCLTGLPCFQVRSGSGLGASANCSVWREYKDPGTVFGHSANNWHFSEAWCAGGQANLGGSKWFFCFLVQVWKQQMCKTSWEWECCMGMIAWSCMELHWSHGLCYFFLTETSLLVDLNTLPVHGVALCSPGTLLADVGELTVLRSFNLTMLQWTKPEKHSSLLRITCIETFVRGKFTEWFGLEGPLKVI